MTATSQAKVPFPLTFAVQAGNPRVDLSLTAGEDGAFVAHVLTGHSLPQRPPVRLGSFAGRLSFATLDALAKAVTESLAAGSAPAQQLPPGTVARLASAGGGATVPLSGDERELSALDEAVAAAVMDALDTPVAAVTVEARPRPGGDPELAVTATGREPFRLVLFASDIEGYWLRVWRDTPAGPDYLPHDAVTSLAEGGTIPQGPTSLTPGETLTVPLPAGSTPGTTGGFIFWRSGAGPERRIVSGPWALPASG